MMESQNIMFQTTKQLYIYIYNETASLHPKFYWSSYGKLIILWDIYIQTTKQIWYDMIYPLVI